MKTTTTNLARRKFIVGSAAAGGGLALGSPLPFVVGEAAAQGAAGTEINAWVVVRPNDTCVVRIARSEMGQGTLTGLARVPVAAGAADQAGLRSHPCDTSSNPCSAIA